MRLLRRVVLALGTAAAIAGVLRVRGTGGIPPQSGGWRELDLDPVSPGDAGTPRDVASPRDAGG